MFCQCVAKFEVLSAYAVNVNQNITYTECSGREKVFCIRLSVCMFFCTLSQIPMKLG